MTGTPIQNNMSELFSIMNLVEANKFPDLDNFLARFGDPVPTPDQLRDLQVPRSPLRNFWISSANLLAPFAVICWVSRFLEILYSRHYIFYSIV